MKQMRAKCWKRRRSRWLVNDALTPEQMLLRAVNDHQVGNKYINADFILGSAAEVERLWSTASLILTKSRSSLLPITFEAIIFLSYNRALWNIHDVHDAVQLGNAEDEDINEQLLNDGQYEQWYANMAGEEE
jgi:hypothetical protein